MKEENKTKKQLINELVRLRKEKIKMEKLIKDHELIEDSLRESEKQCKDIFENANDLIQVIDAKGKYLYVNKKWREKLGYTEEEARQLNFVDVVKKDQIPHCFELLKRVMKGESIEQIETIFVSKDGREFYVEGNVNPPFKDMKVVSCRGIFRDITRRKQMEKEIQRLAITDSLTQAYNRLKFQEIIRREMDRTKRHDYPLSLLMFDIDHFKSINDTYGHNFGDYILKTLTQIVDRNLREVDYLIRWGGEEFLIITPDTNLRAAQILAERIREAIEKYRFNKDVKITVSFGVTQFNKVDTEDTFVKKADEALYKAKGKGRNCVEVTL
jgi:diguanylate cyclase (GGDEF)-like protein/PAS domain S-box-containing protein